MSDRGLTWRELAPGMAYAKLTIGSSESPGFLHAFKIDPAKYRLDCLLAKDLGEKAAPVQTMAKRAKALVAINGGFFSGNLEPLGLRIQNGRERAAMKRVSWWAIFTMNGNAPRIVTHDHFAANGATRMAVQSGPRLVIDGSIPSLKEGDARRTALGITRRGEVIIAVTEQTTISTRTLAEIFRRKPTAGGLDCPNALNLDGGSSTQLYANIKGFTLDLPALAPVTDAVAVFAR